MNGKSEDLHRSGTSQLLITVYHRSSLAKAFQPVINGDEQRYRNRGLVQAFVPRTTKTILDGSLHRRGVTLARFQHRC